MQLLGQIVDPDTSLNINETLSRATAAVWDSSWQSALNGPLYTTLTRLGLTLAVLCGAVFLLQFTKNMLEDETNRSLSELFWIVVVFVLLFNNGAALAGVTTLMRSMVNTTNEQVIGVISQDIRVDKILSAMANYASVRGQIAELSHRCDSFTTNDKVQECLKKVEQDAQTALNAVPADERAGAWYEQLVKFAAAAIQNPLGTLADAATTAAATALKATTAPLLTLVQIILMACQVAFQHLIEASLLLTALLGPIAVATSLLPIGAKPLYAWITAFWSLGICKLSLNIITGLIAVATYNTGPKDLFPASIALGIFAPVAALALSAGGGMAIFNGIVAAIGTTTTIIASGAAAFVGGGK